MVHARTGAEPLRTYNCFEFTAADLDAVMSELTSHRTAASRSKVKGLETNRADIIVAGALILATAAQAFGVGSFTYSEAALREGVLLDTMSRLHGTSGPAAGSMHHLRDVSRRSIRQLIDRCDDDPAHSMHVAALAVALFDALPELHDLGPSAREYLEAGALLANVGLVVAHSKHHLHAYYMIRNSELAGLTDGEIEVIAQIARYHRKSEPKLSHESFAALDSAATSAWCDRWLPSCESRSARPSPRATSHRHQGRNAVAGDGTPATIKPLTINAVAAPDTEIGLELFAADERKDLLEQVLGRPVEIAPGLAT